MAQIGIGLNEGAKQANIDIVGGETASLKGLVNGLDLAVTGLGMQKKDRIIAGDKIKPGHVIIGVASTVVHSNGLSLACRVSRRMLVMTRSSKGRKRSARSSLPLPVFLNQREPESSRVLHGAWH